MRHGIAVVGLLVSATCAFGIVVVDTSQYVQRPDNALVGMLGGGSCVPIGARYALTADHVGVSPKGRIKVNDVLYSIKRVISHPDAPSVDMKIIEIQGPPYFENWVPIHPAPTLVPVHSTIYIGGTGYDTAGPSGGCIAWGARAEHWALNQLEGFFNSATPYAWYRFDQELPNEGIATLYDSGSPMLVMDPDQCRFYLLGIATSASTATGPTCDGHSAYYILASDPWLDQFTGPICAGDLDRDGDTDLYDFMALLGAFSAAEVDCATRSLGDLNDDGIVNIGDFGVLARDYGCLP